jgi:hypothetical protein
MRRREFITLLGLPLSSQPTVSPLGIRPASGEQELVGNPMPTRRRRCQPRSQKPSSTIRRFSAADHRRRRPVSTISRRLMWRVSVRSSIPTISYMPYNSARRPTAGGYLWSAVPAGTCEFQWNKIATMFLSVFLIARSVSCASLALTNYRNNPF